MINRSKNLCSGMKRVFAASVVSLAPLVCESQAGAQWTTWIGPATQDWTASGANWSGGVVPNSASLSVQIDGNSAQNSSIYHQGSISVSNLRVESGDTLSLGTLRLFGNSAQINGTLQLASTGSLSSPKLQVNGSVSLSGSGSVRIRSSISAQPLTTGSGTLVNQILISGQGHIDATGFHFANHGNVIATSFVGDGARTIWMTLGANGAANTGSIIAQTNSAVVIFANDQGFSDRVMDNSGGTLLASGGRFQLKPNVRVNGGVLRSTGAGSFSVEFGSHLANLTNEAAVTLDGGWLLGSVQNNALIRVATHATSAASATLSGTGSLLLSGVQIHSSALTNHSTIVGSGTIGATTSASSVLNSGTIVARTQAGLNRLEIRAFPAFVNTGTLIAESGALMSLSTAAGITGGTIDSTAGVIRVQPAAAVGVYVATSRSMAARDIFNDGDFSVAGISGQGFVSARDIHGSGSLWVESLPLTVRSFRQSTVYVSSGSGSRLQVNAGGGDEGTCLLTNAGSSNLVGGVDLADNDLAVDYEGDSVHDRIRGWVKNGYNGGAWTGFGGYRGILSSSAAAASTTSIRTALGYAEANAVFGSFPATFSGVEVDATAILVSYTLVGDANLDRIVNISDFSQLAAHFNQPGDWIEADFNYDQIVNIADFALLASNFNQSLPLSRGVVPEPGLLGLGALICLVRRKRSATSLQRSA